MAKTRENSASLRAVLSRWGALADDNGLALEAHAEALVATPLSGGLINDTFALGEHHILQRLHPIFGAGVNRDIGALTPILRAAGVPVPRLCETREGALCAEIDGPSEIAGVWRIMTRLDGDTHHTMRSDGQTASAGRMVGRFHEALQHTSHEFAFSRPGAHDTDKHMRSVDEALGDDPLHRLAEEVTPLRDELRARWQAWDGPTELPQRISHGDLKASNLLFNERLDACAVLDLDTMAHLGVDIELGDALRSWCNKAAENRENAEFSASTFEAAVSGYLAVMGPSLTQDERAAIVPGLLRICLELSARFAADAIRESYFGWSPDVAPTRGDHNLLRARGQLDLARQVSDSRAELERLVAERRA